ncbi:MAG: hypothetical protein Q9168_000502 [Polycauliona sp. 1 TL-2023]
MSDTKAFNDFFAASDHPLTPPNSDDHSHPRDKARPEMIARLASTDGDHVRVHGKRTENLVQPEAGTQTLTIRSTPPGGHGSHTLHHDQSNTVNELRPQTLSRLSKEIIKALIYSTRVSHRVSLKDQRTRNVYPTTLADGTASKNAPPIMRIVNVSILPFALQSIIYALCNLSALSSSFMHEVSREGELFSVADPFDDMVQSFAWLRELAGDSLIILSSLLQAADTFSASLLATKNSERLLRDERRSTMQPPINGERTKTSHRVNPEIEASHIVNIIFAALVATIPPCTEEVWEMVQYCHLNDLMVPNLVADSKNLRPLESVLGAFENSTALDLLAKLVKILSDSTPVIRMAPKAVSEEGAPHADSQSQKHILEWILDRLCHVGVKPCAYSDPENTAELCWRYDEPETESPNSYGLSYPSMIIEWLILLAKKRWDGKAEIDMTSTAGNALEVLDRFYEYLGPTRAKSINSHWKSMIDRHNLLDVVKDNVRPIFTTQANHLHLLHFLPPGTDDRVKCFRTLMYSKMSKAHNASIAASRLLAQTTFRDHPEPQSEELDRVIKGYFAIDIRRQSVLVDAFNQLWRRNKRELLKPLKVRMGMDEGEEGVDHGGVQQEFFRVAIAEALRPDYGRYYACGSSHDPVEKDEAENAPGLFTVIDEHTRMNWLRPSSSFPPKLRSKWTFVGMLFGLAIYNGLTLPVNFPIVFYRILSRQGPDLRCLEYLMDGWPRLASGLQSLLKWSDGDVADVFCRTYEYVIEMAGERIHVDMLSPGPIVCRHCGLPGPRPHSKRTGALHELNCPGGKSKVANKPAVGEYPSPGMVTNQNREQYVEDYIDWHVHKSLAWEFYAMSQGFFACISPGEISIFPAPELKRLVEGIQDITAEGLHKIARYEGGYTAGHATIHDFWTTVEDFTPKQMGALLEFVTASDRLPATGTDNLSISIQRNGEGDRRLPTSLTCFGRLLLPEYTSREVLREKLCLAMENSKGFGVP